MNSLNEIRKLFSLFHQACEEFESGLSLSFFPKRGGGLADFATFEFSKNIGVFEKNIQKLLIRINRLKKRYKKLSYRWTFRFFENKKYFNFEIDSESSNHLSNALNK